MAAVLNFAGAFISFKVAATIAKGIVDPDAITLQILLAGLVGAITWNLDHVVPRAAVELEPRADRRHHGVGGRWRQGWDVVQWNGLWTKVLKPSLIAPFAGLAVAFLLMTLIVWLVARRSPAKVNRVFRRGQLVSGGFVALTHGTNDAQKTMGIIALALVASGHLDADFTRPPTWVIVSAALAMSAGTYAGGWRIIRTLGTRIAKIDPPQGFAAQTACASILWTTAHFGYPRLDDPRDLGLGDGRRRDARPARGPLGRGRQHRARRGSSRSRWRGARRRVHGARRRASPPAT